MKLSVLQGENFSCQSCTHCCRNWHVVLMEGEAEKIQSLTWPTGDPLAGKDVLLSHGGKTYLRHNRETGCVFLNLSNGKCRIHEQFGVPAKPLGCSIFPFQISATFPGQASVSSRFDCPTVRKNQGESHVNQLPTLRQYASKINLTQAFDETIACHLEPEQIQSVAEYVSTLLVAFPRDDQKALFIAFLCDGLSTTGASELDRESLAQAFSTLKRLVESASDSPPVKPGFLHRIAFRTLLGLYVRRDEDVLNGRAGRFRRLLGMTAMVFGFGSFRAMGLSHPKGSLRRAKLFKSPLASANNQTFDLFWRMIRTKLESFQFMGEGNNGRDFLSGLRSLALLYPLAVACAKYRAANRGANQIDPEDVDYAVATIEHAFGRLPILNQPFTRTYEKLLQQRDVFVSLIRSF